MYTHHLTGLLCEEQGNVISMVKEKWCVRAMGEIPRNHLSVFDQALHSPPTSLIPRPGAHLLRAVLVIYGIHENYVENPGP